MMGLDRGDICLVDFNPAKGSEMGKLRPAIIISQKNEIDLLQTIIVIPLSSIIEKDTFPYRIFLPKRGQLEKDSDACIYEIRALSKKRIKSKVAKLTTSELKLVQKSLCELLR